jgi:hypothetical protein
MRNSLHSSDVHMLQAAMLTPVPTLELRMKHVMSGAIKVASTLRHC